jgi:hypothetical protein
MYIRPDGSDFDAVPVESRCHMHWIAMPQNVASLAAARPIYLAGAQQLRFTIERLLAIEAQRHRVPRGCDGGEAGAA